MSRQHPNNTDENIDEVPTHDLSPREAGAPIPSSCPTEERRHLSKSLATEACQRSLHHTSQVNLH